MSSAVHRYVYSPGTNPGGQDIININELQNPLNVSALVDIVSGSASYVLEITMDNLEGDATNFRWTSLPSNDLEYTATTLFAITNPITGIRLNLSANTGEVRFTVIQSPASL